MEVEIPARDLLTTCPLNNWEKKSTMFVFIPSYTSSQRPVYNQGLETQNALKSCQKTHMGTHSEHNASQDLYFRLCG